MTRTDPPMPPCGPERDRLVAEAVGWSIPHPLIVVDGEQSMRAPSTSDADALAALEAWRTGNGICSYAVASPDPVDPGFRACLWYSADGQSVADCEASAPTLRDAATAALVRWRNERSQS